MVYGVILAGGVGNRMGNAEKPKQFLLLGSKPIIVHTIEKFYVNEKFERILVLCPEQWLMYTKNLIQKYLGDTDRIIVIPGGATRNETIMNAIRYIDREDGVTDDTIIVTHDAVRPFVTHRILEENIAQASRYGACDTVVPATDTIVRSDDNTVITEIPDRSRLYQGQTPQSFNARKLWDLYESLTPEEKEILTDAAKIFAIRGEKVYLVDGEVYNIKITYPYDLKVAEILIKGSDALC